MRIFLLLFISLCILGCNKPNPHPEKLDPIFADLQKRSSEAKKMADEEKKKFLDFEKEMKEVKPQTGKIKYVEKRYYESKLRYEKLLQLALYYEMRAESRVKYDRIEYLKSWNKKEPWPNPVEYKEYMAVTDSEFKSKVWNVNERINKYLEENPNLPRNKKKSKDEEKDSGKSSGGGH